MTRRVLPYLTLALALTPPALAQDDAPILRIETGMHTAPIHSIDTDAAGRFLVTGSHDKTVRVWSLEDGALLRVLRPPIGEGNEGKVYAVAISPDGEVAAAGGWTSSSGLNGSVYLFDRRTGRLLRRLKGLPSVVHHLVFDRGGERLVATLGGANGVRVFRTADGIEVGHDTDYGSGSGGASFDPGGRLVTTSLDGKLRLYDREFARIAETEAPGGERPYGAAFSPDGRRIAVGYEDNLRVDVLSGDDLTWLMSADTEKTNGNLSTVAWSADGTVLFGAGSHSVNGMNPIRRFANAGSGVWSGTGRDLDGPSNTVMGLRGLPGSRLAYGSSDPAWGVLNADGQRVLAREPSIADFRDLSEGILVDARGTKVRLAYDKGKETALFSLPDRTLVLDPPTDTVLRSPRTQMEGIEVTGWKNTTDPKLNGEPLALGTYEMSRSLALAPDGQGFVLGTEWYVRSFASDGKERWAKPATGVAWAVNVTADGRLVVAAFGDGTIRWFRYGDGQELLALFPHRDRRRWVLWTPSGYYDASVDGEDLIGWHVNNGPDQAADFYSAWHFRNRYRRPAVVELILETLDEAEAVRRANVVAKLKAVPPPPPVQETLPPTVTVLDPADGTRFDTPSVRVRVNVRSPSGAKVDRIRALVDGQALGKSRGVLFEGSATGTRTRDFTETLDVPVPPRDCLVEIVAEAGGRSSEPAALRLKWSKPVPVATTRLFVLAVGVSSYKDPAYKLDFAAKDATDVARAFKGLEGRRYKSVDTTVLRDADATHGSILDALDQLKTKVRDDDFVVLFLAGHGINDGEYYFLPHDADLGRKYSTLLSQNQIQGVLLDLPGRVLLFLDTCRAGSLMASGLAQNEQALRQRIDVTNFVNAMTYSNTGVVVYSASSAREFSLESSEWKNGIFTRVLVEGLAGAADGNSDGEIMTSELEGYLAREVRKRTGGVQTPVMAKPGGVPDLLLARPR